jgi:hypothetical protein
MKRASGLALPLVAAALISCGQAKERPPSWRGYNVIWISYDSVRAYDTWMKQVMKTHHIAEDAELHEQLKALGYVR